MNLIEWLGKDMLTWDSMQLRVNQDGKRMFVAVPHIADQRIVLQFLRERLRAFEATLEPKQGASDAQ